MEISWLGLIGIIIFTSTLTKLYLKTKEGNMKEKQEEVFVNIPLSEAIIVQQYIESRPIREAYKVFQIISKHVGVAINQRDSLSQKSDSADP